MHTESLQALGVVFALVGILAIIGLGLGVGDVRSPFGERSDTEDTSKRKENIRIALLSTALMAIGICLILFPLPTMRILVGTFLIGCAILFTRALFPKQPHEITSD